MQDYVLFGDSNTDLSPELIAEMDTVIMPMTFTMEGKNYKNWPDGRDMAMKDFYDAMRRGATATTSQLSMQELNEYFTPALKEGKDVLYLCFASALSGTFQTANIVAADLQEQFPGRRVVIVDTKQASMGQGLLTYAAAQLYRAGKSLDEVAQFVEQEGGKFCSWFTVDDLVYLKRGGRLSGAAALAGTLLGIKPVLHVEPDGRLTAQEKVRGRKASLDALVKHYETGAEDHANQIVFICHADCIEDANYVADKVRAIGAARIEINVMGPVIGAHVGPGAMTIFFTGSGR